MTEEPIQYATSKKPDLQGRFGKAWKQDEKSSIKRNPDFKPQSESTLIGWIVYGPSYHPLWDYYYIGCVFLKDIEGMPPAIIHLEGATHEVFVIALNPDHTPALNDGLYMLTPINFSAQFISTDEEALKKMEDAVREI